MSKKPEMHQSQLCMMQMCAECYRRRVIEKEYGRSSCALIGGSSVHVGREVNLKQKIKSKVDAPVLAVTEAARDYVVKTFSERDVDPGEEYEGLNSKTVCQQVIDRAVGMAIADYNGFQRKMQPVEVELKIGIVLKNYPFDLGMKLDAVEDIGGEVVSDCKTSKRTPAKDIADTSEQLALYSLGAHAKYGRPAKALRLDYVVPLKSGTKCISITTTPNKSSQQAVLNRMAVAYEATEKGIFVPCSPTHWKCSQAYCEFYETCRYVGRRDRPKN
jgi:hypothetical protein